jgi:5-methylcytosine-specific restriction enzyme A
MPSSPKRPCAYAGCSILVYKGFCPKHEKKAALELNKRRGSPASRGYGHEWQKLREQILARDLRLCQQCRREGRAWPAKDVDHIIAKSKGGSDDSSNLESLCHTHHSRKTAREDGRWQPNQHLLKSNEIKLQ